MTWYSLLVQNNSSSGGDICVYQTDSSMSPSNVQSLAWMTARAHPGVPHTFAWNLQHHFVCGELSRSLKPGLVFNASQICPADLTNGSTVTLTEEYGGLTFQHLHAGPLAGQLRVLQDHSLARETATVGIGMFGAATFVTRAVPQMTLAFSPHHPVYWVAFGSFEQGQLLDHTQISNPARIAFPEHQYAITATLEADGTWTVAPTWA